MSLSQRCRDSFEAHDVKRGDDYFHNDRAILANTTEQQLHFTVFGSMDTYLVEIQLESLQEGLVATYCECNRFEDGYFCKHIWASLRQLDSQVDVPGDGKLKLYFNDDPDVAFRPKSDSNWQSKPGRKKQQSWRQPFRIAKSLLQETPPSTRTHRLAQLAGGGLKMWYVVQRPDLDHTPNLVIRTFESVRKQDGQWGVAQRKNLSGSELQQYANAEDAVILRQFKPAGSPSGQDVFGSYYNSNGFVIPTSKIGEILPGLLATERLVWSDSDDQYLRDAQPLLWDDRNWNLRFHVKPSDTLANHVQVHPELVAEDGELRPTEAIDGAYSDGFLIIDRVLTTIRERDARWIAALRQQAMVPVPLDELDDLLAMLCSLPQLPVLLIAPQLKVPQATGVPIGKIIIHYEERQASALIVEPLVKYGDAEFSLADERMESWQPETGTLLRRNFGDEERWLQGLKKFPFEKIQHHATGEPQLTIPLKRFATLATQLVNDGWEVVAHGKTVRQATSFDIRVQSDNDWFDLRADADFNGVSASLPSLLSALKQRSQFVTLDDGSQGILPADWLQRYAKLADVATPMQEGFRFAKSQALLLDSLLAEQDVQVDRDFNKLIKQLQAFEGIAPAKPPRGFQGNLRDYQRDGVGWLSFLREFGFGGCLADDMGLGKTIQVLAMLESRRTRRLKKDERRRPSIVIVPKSLVFNWLDEASRFTPKLKTLNYTGTERFERFESVEDAHLLITTYGTLRRDIELLKDTQFDYVILDEAQAVKNANSLAAKAVRLVHAQHRLAMTGTPVENHLGELWSLFDFLNPGMLGSSTAFKRIAKPNDESGPKALAWLGNAIRPFILRRTKKQVLSELPEKIEQTLVCDMLPKQKEKYQELRAYYRAHLSKKVDEMGINRSKIHVLEALLRLRQAACDPRLLGEDEPAGAKIELLLEQLQSLLGDGHKALIFSQFTSLLQIVRQELDDRGWTYEYLDGKTRKRAERVERFQTDPECPIFLISMKAGGSGLNLTAADYVFILDPWWNPAVEAQAVDRAHRLGQTKSVMAYRILCRNTVEDKIVKMQSSKRDLADAIITSDKSLISQLSLDDLQMLLE